jgi:putative ABC transport system ATP-binding protein
MSDLLIRTEELRKDYPLGQQRVQALRGVSVEMRRGEFLAVMGPSGSGKSTFMNLLGCLDRPTSGKYYLDDADVSCFSTDDLAQTRNVKIGFVFQTFNLLPRTTAIQNVELPLRYSQAPRNQRRQKAEAVLESVGLKDRADHQSYQLSGGQQQRVAIARALVNDPVLILADEPTGALDTQTGAEILRLFQDLNHKGISIVLVTHEHEIARYAERILHFRDGKIINAEVVEKVSECS